MALSTAKFTELPPHLFSSFSTPSTRPAFSLFLKPFSSLRRTGGNTRTNNRDQRKPYRDSNSNSTPVKSKPNKSHSSTWLNKWPNTSPSVEHSSSNSRTFDSNTETKYFDENTSRVGTTAIERIVLRLRNLGLGSDDEDENEEEENSNLNSSSAVPSNGEEEKLGDLLKRDWVRPDMILGESDDDEGDDTLLPWERNVEEGEVVVEEQRGGKRRTVKAPTLAELTIEDEELRRLRRNGMTLRERVSVPKAGITGAVLEKIHDAWRKNELVRLKFHEVLAHDMRTGHEIVERRTGGLVIWRAGSVMVVYRGSNYEGPSLRSRSVNENGNALFVPDVSSDKSIAKDDKSSNPVIENRNQVHPHRVQSMTEEEAEFNRLLDGLGPRYEDWWGTGVIPVDADLLPQTIPGYKTPFRLLPTGMRSRLTNAEMTNLRKIAKSLPCHFALGRNRNHQGLAAAIIKLWEKSLVVKIAVKRGIQNTNNKLMAEELKKLTGGVLLLRNKYYIIFYRGKDFLPPTVAAALAERQEITKQIQDVEEKTRSGPAEPAPLATDAQAVAGTLAEFYEAQARWGREISDEEREKMLKEAARAKIARVVKRLEHKLELSQAKKLKAEKILAKIVDSWIPAGPSDDLETITEEERVMYRRVGLRMKSYLPLGIRGVFDGVIENMHLHWKHRELVKLISKEKELAFVEETARLLEYESGGILVAIDRVPKGYALIFYRGKNYRRPISLRPRNLLTKAKALKRRVALQRYEALSQHMTELETSIEQTKRQIGDVGNAGINNSNLEALIQFNHVSEFSQSEDEASSLESDGDEDEDPEWENDDDSEYSSLEDI
ncbi:CRM-domain containing factor CFM3, chloroplastic/mitochondrial [Nicotiana sylvestris]|uniref:CRM-domain containing factor CFM3, chloroplastic/mitochondrial n=2 Tax=Nicotiana TaxID=4085 RepID=A0A1S4AQM5_TOBAC|nr:PREDICTED: chloroplastic group IIA intron splicing facilitator CRS1, chloroplastic [Nicotiana sylvestris]XP_009767027.1 PREDICTED: chloroplastic group IIA intron splicing facilitator CRS1, chloroplastic [Nicotiana sylvestris]XP_016479052.1 PREDICTED: CRM-domain containing factor CFM3, chloroplastic/mitochondrial-like [Nicotiana tabacum]XP_016479053.1 PREDICTED: CRM-domain containing factor CFM3, chloroplastic/mitochondrial-like [Nicotiana tabacum]